MEIFVDNELSFLKQIPSEHGVYRYYDKNNDLLYVGKAINLRSRVKSYFQKNQSNSPRIVVMVNKITKIELTITENETSALLLESNLIKNLKPRYNIIFRDDKSYPYLKITAHEYPVIEYYRGKSKAGNLYGPYPNSYAVKETLETLQKLFKLRTCSDNDFASRSRPCLLYQIERCSAPCVGKISFNDYSENIKEADKFLSGDYASLVSILSNQMYSFAEAMDFEKAATIRDKIAFIRNLQSQQIISDSNSPLNADILLINDSLADKLIIYLIYIRKGLYVGDKHYNVLRLSPVDDLVEGFIERYYSNTSCETLFLEMPVSDEFIGFMKNINSMKISYKFDDRISKLFEMGKKNLLQIVENSSINNIYISAISKLSELLQVTFINRIECYDVSHNHGISAVASMVVYQDNKIDKSKYRRYNLPNTINGNDLEAFSYVLRRRLNNNEDIPDVILVDGGKLQFALAKNILADLGFHDKISVIGIYKGENRNPVLDRVIINESTQLEYNSEREVFRLLQMLRDEAHRFAISAHRKSEINRMSISRLDDIDTLGVKKKKALIVFFGSVENIAKESIDDLMQV
ncbi:MAG: excinuclease ABC subunit UvrC, partial [Burkholderiales bacterium]|nr:excinuclease ABC subunit UvrC [Burkholderiales bacterium]